MNTILAIIVILGLGTWLFIVSVPGFKNVSNRLKFTVGKYEFDLPNVSKRLTKKDKYTIQVLGLLLLTVGLLFLYLTISKSVVLSASPESKQPEKYLGQGWADLNGPSSIPIGGSARVVLTISLYRDYIQIPLMRSTKEDRPPISTEINPKDPTLVNGKEERIPIYERMRAKLDAPSFEYNDRDWLWENISNRADWIWNIKPKEGSIGPQVLTVFLSGPENSGYRNIKFFMIVEVSQRATTPRLLSMIISVNPPNAGIVTGTGSYPDNTLVTIQAVPYPGWEFTGWSGDMSGNQDTILVIMNENKSVIANFIQTITPTPAPVATPVPTVAPTPAPIAPPSPWPGNRLGWVIGILVAVALVVAVVVWLARK